MKGVCAECVESVEEAEDLATNVLSSCLVLVHDAGRSGQHNETELLGRQQSVAPATNLLERNIKPRADAAALRGVRAVWEQKISHVPAHPQCPSERRKKERMRTLAQAGNSNITRQ